MNRLANIGRPLGVLLATIFVLVICVLCAIYGCAWVVHRWNLTAGWWLGVFLACIFVPLFGLYVFVIRHVIRNRWRVSMKSSVVGVSICCVLFACFGHVYREQLKRQNAIYRFWMAGGKVEPSRAYSVWHPGRSYGDRNFLHDAIGFDPFDKIHTVTLNDERALLVIAENPDTFRNVETILLQCDIKDWQQTACLNKIPTLKNAIIQTFGIIDVDAIAQWKNVESVRFFACRQFTGAFADEEIEALTKLKNLKTLDFWQIDISDKGLSSLAALPSLNGLHLLETKVTENGVDQLESSLPECRVITDVRAK